MAPVFAAQFEQARDELWDLLGAFLASYAERQPVGKVAVVGNAPLAPDPARAAEIDSSDLVIRANSMALDEPGDPPCLGTRCHAVILSHATRNTPWVFRDYRRRAYLAPQAGAVRYYKIGPAVSFWPNDLGVIPIPNGVVKKRLVDLMDPDHVPGELTPTTGLMGLYLAHELFPDADMVATGFSFLDGGEQESWQHHSGGETAVNRFHDLALEGALLRSWIADGSTRFLP
jgi:hypothetical protein